MICKDILDSRTNSYKGEILVRCSYHQERSHLYRNEFEKKPKFKCPENKCNKELNFAECYFSTCCHEAMKNCRTSSEKVTLEHIADKIKSQENQNKEIEEVIKKYQDDLEIGRENLRNLTATQERYKNFHCPPEINEGKDVCFRKY